MELQDIREWAQIWWPPSMQNLEVSGERGIDALAYIRLDLDEADLAQFTNVLGFSEPLKPGVWPFPRISEAPPWWTPVEDSGTLGGEVLWNGLARELVVERSSSGTVTVFLRTFQV